MKARDIDLDVSYEIQLTGADGRAYLRGMVLDLTQRAPVLCESEIGRGKELTGFVRPGESLSPGGLVVVYVIEPSPVMTEERLLAATRQARAALARDGSVLWPSRHAYVSGEIRCDVIPARQFVQPWSAVEDQRARMDRENDEYRAAHEAERAAEFAAIDHVAAVLGRPEEGPLADALEALRDLRERNMSNGLGHQVRDLCQAYADAMVRRTPEEWQRVTGTRVLDPDGWRHAPGEYPERDWSEPITRAEWDIRAARSTTSSMTR